MTQNTNQPLQAALDQARKLSVPGQTPAATALWAARAHHVGDLSVLALALRG